jgi:hypothetical protein
MERRFTPMFGFSPRLARLLTLLFAAISVLGCSKGSSSTGSAPSASATTASVDAAPPPPPPRPVRSSWPIPGGPRLAVLAGQGVGPIRFGATVATIERHMQGPCDLKTEQVCRYYARAIEFGLKDGVLAAIHIHRMDRPAGNDATGKARVYGAFHGGIPPDLRMGMLPWAIQQYMGKPKKIEQLPGNPPNYTVQLHHYDGLVLEFDKLGTNEPVLGGILIAKPQ